jgi:hypothetical protein
MFACGSMAFSAANLRPLVRVCSSVPERVVRSNSLGGGDFSQPNRSVRGAPGLAVFETWETNQKIFVFVHSLAASAWTTDLFTLEGAPSKLPLWRGFFSTAVNVAPSPNAQRLSFPFWESAPISFTIFLTSLKDIAYYSYITR